MLTRTVAWLCRFPVIRRRLWMHWYDFLARQYREGDWTFMNYGYHSPDAQPLALKPEDDPDRYSIQLYHFVASSLDLTGKHVLEVGSGRGGGSSYVKRYLGPATVMGVDFSAHAVEFCRTRHRVEGLSFREGSAEALPLEDASFDAVLNVESSHCYASMQQFLTEVHRVLRPGGFFLHADLRSGNGLAEWKDQLGKSGLRMVAEENITPHVLAALDRDNDRKAALIERFIPKMLAAPFRDFAGMRDSVIYDGFRSGSYTYRFFAMQKPAE